MNICIITPAPARSRTGNRVTALRWARILRDLGHRVVIKQEYDGRNCELMVALHARRSYWSIRLFRRRHADAPLIVALTGTDLYKDLRTQASARHALELATRLIVLQPAGVDELPARFRSKARVIFQSVDPPQSALGRRVQSGKAFQVCLIGHLRPVKDPFRTAMAVRMLPRSSHIRVTHLGAAMGDAIQKRAESESAANPRYRWWGEVPRWRSLRILARSQILVLTSKMEGGANVVSEAIAVSVPVLSSRIGGSVGILGPDYPGYFPIGDTRALASLLYRTETDTAFYQSLKRWCARLAPIVEPARERQSWADLIHELHG